MGTRVSSCGGCGIRNAGYAIVNIADTNRYRKLQRINNAIVLDQQPRQQRAIPLVLDFQLLLCALHDINHSCLSILWFGKAMSVCVSTSPTTADLLIQNSTRHERLPLRREAPVPRLNGSRRLKSSPVKTCQHTYNL